MVFSKSSYFIKSKGTTSSLVSFFTICGLIESSFKLLNRSLSPEYNAEICSAVTSLFKVFLSISTILFALWIISSAYKLPRPFLASVLTTSLSSLNSSLNSSSLTVIGLIPLSSGKMYSLLELMSLSLISFLFRGWMILLSSSKRIMLPLSNNSTIIV